MLAALTCHFNPCNYNKPIENYWRFREKLPEKLPLYTIELSFNNDFSIPDAYHINGTEDNILWQKESLINILIKSIPSQYTKVAWLDADILFLNEDWYKDAEKLLDTHTAVQLFERVFRLNFCGGVEHIIPSLTYYKDKINEHDGVGEPGFAWAAKRDFLLSVGGLYDQHILGGNDSLFVNAMMGEFNSIPYKRLHYTLKRQYLAQAVKYYKGAKNNITYVEGEICHFYHGTIRKRKYKERNKILEEHQYNPKKDIEYDEKGLLKWTTNNQKFKEDVKNYFFEREEDD